MSLDLASLDALKSNQEDGADLQVKHPVTGEPTGFVLRIAGSDSETVKRVQRRQVNERLRSRAKTLTAEDIERSTREASISSILGWRFEEGAHISGATPEFSKDEAEKLLKRWPWLQVQIDDFAGDRANFLSS